MKKIAQTLFCHAGKKIILTFSSLLFFCVISSAQTAHYVAVTGSNTGTGTFANPYNTIPKAIAAVSTINGDTIKIAPGNYTGTVTVNKHYLYKEQVRPTQMLF